MPEVSKEDQEGMIKEFLCPGCTCGNDPKDCRAFKVSLEAASGSDQVFFSCAGHSAGVFGIGPGRIALGMPKGFNRYGGSVPPSHVDAAAEEARSGKYTPGRGDVMNMHPMYINLWDGANRPVYDWLNVPVWALEQDGYLFVRVYSPRVNGTRVDVIKGGKKAEICPAAHVPDLEAID